jgi:serine/threonine protein kinase
MRPKLADFGFAYRLSSDDDVSEAGFYGTPEYASPEMLRGAPYGLKVLPAPARSRGGGG